MSSVGEEMATSGELAVRGKEQLLRFIKLQEDNSIEEIANSVLR